METKFPESLLCYDFFICIICCVMSGKMPSHACMGNCFVLTQLSLSLFFPSCLESYCRQGIHVNVQRKSNILAQNYSFIYYL